MCSKNKEDYNMKNKYKLALSIIMGYLILAGCIQRNAQQMDISAKSTEELIQLLEDPNDPNNLFAAITTELANRGSSASKSAPALAKALTYPRRDSYLAGFALIAIGPDAKSVIPILVSELSHERTTVRRYAALSLGSIGKPAECSIPQLATLLWHSDSDTRVAASIAIDAITGINLVDPEAKLDPKTIGVMPIDEPEGVLSDPAKEWWVTTGENLDWPKDNCLSTN